MPGHCAGLFHVHRSSSVTCYTLQIVVTRACELHSLLCKSQGAEPSILRFLFIFFVSPSFLPYEDKNPPSAISCSFISKLVTVLPFQSKNRTLLLATDRFWILAFCCSIQKIVFANLFKLISWAERKHTTYYQKPNILLTAKQIKNERSDLTLFWAEAPWNCDPASRQRESTSGVSLQWS